VTDRGTLKIINLVGDRPNCVKMVPILEATDEVPAPGKLCCRYDSARDS
jgi:hypothetical protein